MTAGPLRGRKRLRDERPSALGARRADAAGADAELVLDAHSHSCAHRANTLIEQRERRGRRPRRQGAPREFGSQAIEKPRPSSRAHRAFLSRHRAVVLPSSCLNALHSTPEHAMTRMGTAVVIAASRCRRVLRIERVNALRMRWRLAFVARSVRSRADARDALRLLFRRHQSVRRRAGRSSKQAD